MPLNVPMPPDVPMPLNVPMPPDVPMTPNAPMPPNVPMTPNAPMQQNVSMPTNVPMTPNAPALCEVQRHLKQNLPATFRRAAAAILRLGPEVRSNVPRASRPPFESRDSAPGSRSRSGHPSSRCPRHPGWLKIKKNRLIIKLPNIGVSAVVVAQLVEWSLPTPEVRGSNPVIGKYLYGMFTLSLKWAVPASFSLFLSFLQTVSSKYV